MITAPRKIVLRPYQAECLDRIDAELEEKRSTLIVLPTGCGKTTVFAGAIARRHEIAGTNTLVIAHRDELIRQAAERISRQAGLAVDIEMADSRAGFGWARAPVVCASIQTLSMNGCKRAARLLEGDRPIRFIVVDEAHHAVASSYRKVLDLFMGAEPDCRLLGVTATPDRQDEAALGQVFESVAFDMHIADAIKAGWLVRIRQKYIYCKSLDLSGVHTQAGDLKQSELGDVVENERLVWEMVGPMLERTRGLRTLIFAVNVKHATLVRDNINAREPGTAALVTGETDMDERKAIFRAFGEGRLQRLVNVGIACLDEETEILTTTGWVGIDGINVDHEIACYEPSDGTIRFEIVRGIERRDRRPDEPMVCVESRMASHRVTGDHRLLLGGAEVRGIDAPGRKAVLTVSGLAEPREWKEEIGYEIGDEKAAIRNLAYRLRKEGVEQGAARLQAEYQVRERKSLRVRLPSELTRTHLQFIGVFVGDGTMSRLSRGGVEYVLHGDNRCPKIAEWIDSIIGPMGVDVKRSRTKDNGYRWSFGRGTGGRSQRRVGLFEIEPYLCKDGGEWLWSLNREQFRAFCQGLFMANGEHGDCRYPPVDSMRGISTRRKALRDIVQAVGVCRGFSVSSPAEPDGNGIWSFTVRDTTKLTVVSGFAREPEWKSERVWCVKSATGWIIARRRGKVCVTGNTEGWDDPALDGKGVQCIAMMRPTKSRALYSQCIGRGTRSLPGVIDGIDTPEGRCAAIAASAKPSVLILDFVGNSGRHQLIHAPDVLGGRVSDAAEKRVRAKGDAKNEQAEFDVLSEMDRAEREIAEEAERKRLAKVRSAARADFAEKEVDPFRFVGLEPTRIPGYFRGKPASDAQRGLLQKYRCPVPHDLNFVHAKQLLDKLTKEPTPGQKWKLKQLGIPSDGLDFRGAINAISRATGQ